MKHDMSPFEGIEIKGDEDTPDDVVTKALDEFTKATGERLDAIEAKADTSALVERLDALEARSARARGTSETKGTETEERKAFAAYLSRGDSAGADNLKTLTVANDPTAGYLAPPEMSAEFIRELVEFSPIRTVASVRSTSAPSVIYPKRTGITNARWVGEIEERTASEPAFAQAQVEVHELATFVDVSKQLLADSAGQAEAEVRAALAEDFGQKEALAFLIGDGAKKPKGLLTETAIAEVPNGHATNLDTDALIALMYSLPAAYRQRGTWAMNGATLAKLMTVKGSDGQYIWRPGIAEDRPQTILGRPVVEMVDMPDVAGGATPIIFGDFTGYRILDRLGLDVLVDPYTQATNGITRIHARRRVGGRVLEPAKFRKLSMTA